MAVADTDVVRKARRIYAQIGEEDRTLAETFLPLVRDYDESWGILRKRSRRDGPISRPGRKR